MIAHPFFSIMQVTHTQTHVRARSCVCVRACVRTEFYKDIKIWFLRAQMHVRFWVFNFGSFCLFVWVFFFVFLFVRFFFWWRGGILGVFVCLGFFFPFVCLFGVFLVFGGGILMTLNCLTYNRLKIFRKVVPFP